MDRFGTKKRSWLHPGGAFLGLVCAFLWVVAGSSSGRAQAPAFREYDVKAVFLYNFTQFVEWPSNAFATAESPLVIGLYGRDPFAGALAQAVKGETVHGRAIEVRRVQNEQEASRCHLVFVPADANAEADLLRALRGRAVLTVGESPTFIRQGGMVRFTRKDRTVGFVVDDRMARKAGLRVSAQLLKLAAAAEERP